MGEVAKTEKLKLQASFYNNLATGCVITGYGVPYFALMRGLWNDPNFGSLAGLFKVYTEKEIWLLAALGVWTLLAAWLLWRIANSAIEQIED